MLTATQRTTLLLIARNSIAAVLDGKRPDFSQYTLDDDLRRPSGAFVTLNNRRGELRGCIGSIEPIAALYQAVSSSAIHAAFRDPRFYPVRRDELPLLRIEISVMGPVTRVTDVAEVEVGRDGLIISRGQYAGLLLPQVAIEWGWDRDMFLCQTCTKAGLPSDAWRSGDTKIDRFSAEVFCEELTEP